MYEVKSKRVDLGNNANFEKLFIMIELQKIVLCISGTF